MNRYNFKKASPIDLDESNVSDADQNDIEQILKDANELDDDIFKSLGPKQTPSSLSKTMPATAKKTNLGFGSDEDIFDDLDKLVGKQAPTLSRQLSAGDKKPPIQKPANSQLSSTMPNKASKNMISFDDDDLGLFSDKPKTTTVAKSNESTLKKKSLSDELFGKNNDDSFGETKASAPAYHQQLSLNVPKSTDDALSFGGYVPSNARGTGSNTLKRNVSFTDDIMFDDVLSATSRPRTSPQVNQSDKNEQPNLMMRTMPAPANKKSAFDFDFDFDSLIKPKAQAPGATSTMKSSAASETKKSDTNWLENLESPNRQLAQTMPAGQAQKPTPSVGAAPTLATANRNQSTGFELGKLSSARDSMNSSFADSIENADIKSPPNPVQPTQPPLDLNLLTNKSSLNEKTLTANETDGGWLGGLITNKQTPLPKKTTNAASVSYDTNDLQSLLQRIKQLEYENQDLNMQLQHNKTHYELQIKLTQESCDNRLQAMKEDKENMIKHYKEEKQSLQDQIEQIERDKSEMSTNYKQKLDERQREFDAELDKMRQIQKETIENLKLDHEEVINRIRKLKDTEIDAALASRSHTRTIESAINMIEFNAKSLDEISQRVEKGHLTNLSETENQIRKKENELKLQEERLSRQQREYEVEIRSLNETIQRLENHLAEQTKSMAEERWKGKQQEKKMEALQEALINEQRLVMEKLARERNDIERSKDEILVEQKRLMQQIYEEKRKIAEEKATLEASIVAYKDKKHKDSLNNINIEAEISVSSRRLNDEKARLEQLNNDLKERELKLKHELQKLDEKRQELETKAAKLEQVSFSINQKHIQAQELYSKATREKDSQMKIFEQTNNIKLNHDSRLNQIQQQLTVLNEREAQINQEKVALYKYRQELEAFKSTLTCNKCKEPIRDFSVLGMGPAPQSYANGVSNKFTLKSSFRYQSPLVSHISNSELEEAKLLRQLKLQAYKDKQFLNEEKQFIDTIKSGTSFNTKSSSMIQLNSTFA